MSEETLKEEKQEEFDETQLFKTTCKWTGSGKKLEYWQVVEEPGFNLRKTTNEDHIDWLEESIKQQGLKRPVEVIYWKRGRIGGEEKDIYKVVNGHNRFLAIRNLLENDNEEKYKSFDVKLIDKKTPHEKLKMLMYTDNIADPLNIADECEFLAEFTKFGWKYQDIYNKFGFGKTSYNTVRMKTYVGQFGSTKMLNELREGKMSLKDAYDIIAKEDENDDIEKAEINDLPIDEQAKLDAIKYLDDFDKKRAQQLEEKKKKKKEDFETWQRFYAICIANIPDEDFTDLTPEITKMMKKFKLEISFKDGIRKVEYDKGEIEEKEPDVDVADDGEKVID